VLTCTRTQLLHRGVCAFEGIPAVIRSKVSRVWVVTVAWHQVDGELTPYTHLVDASGWQSQNAYRKRTVSVTTCLDSYPTKFQMSSTQLQSYGWWKVTVQCSDFPCPWIIMEDPAGIDGSSFFDRPEFWIGKRNYGRRGRMKELLNVDASACPTATLPGRVRGSQLSYSDGGGRGANRIVRVWHGATKNGP
jgi:hypothetical protein